LTTITDRRLSIGNPKLEVRKSKEIQNSKSRNPKLKTELIQAGELRKSPSVATPLGTELRPKPVEVKWHDSPKRCLIRRRRQSERHSLSSRAGDKPPGSDAEATPAEERHLTTAKSTKHRPEAYATQTPKPQTTPSQTLLTNLFIYLEPLTQLVKEQLDIASPGI